MNTDRGPGTYRVGSNINNNNVNMFPGLKNPPPTHMNQQDSFDDEFSDFQSAPVITQGPIKELRHGMETGLPNSVHAQVPVQNFKPGSGPVVQVPTSLPIKGKISANKQNAVGYRLANYDLGIPTSSPQLNTNKGNVLNTPPAKPASGQPYQNGDSLLIGEEDKYSALRELVSDVGSSASLFQSVTPPPIPQYLPTVSHFDGNIEHKISLVGDDVLEIVKTEPVDGGAEMDFGDFQSFAPKNVPAPTAAMHPIVPPTDLTSAVECSKDLFSLDSSFAGARVTNSKQTPISNIANSFNEISTFTKSVDLNDFSNSNESEFGDFVSSKPSFPILPPSPKVNLRTDVHKKAANPVGTKSRKGSQNSGKISANSIAKASNLLSESPTYPRKLIDVIGGDISFSASVSIPPQSINLLSDLEGLDFYTQPSTLGTEFHKVESDKVHKIDTGTTLKTTLIGGYDCASELEEFSSGVQAIPEVPAKMVGLDMLPLNKPNYPIAAETQSLSSLDLGNYLESGGMKTQPDSDASPEELNIIGFESYSKESRDNCQSISMTPPGFESEPYCELNFSPTAASPAEDASDDKYHVFKEEIDNERERCTTEWSKCLACCLEIISRAQGILMSVSSSEVAREVLSNEKGYNYALNLIEVYLVSYRIHQAWRKLGGGRKINELFNEISASWELLLQFFMGTPVSEQISNMNLEEDEVDYSDTYKICGVCLISSKGEKSESLIDYGGKYYHPACANLWINEVDSILPSLYCVSLPSLCNA